MGRGNPSSIRADFLLILFQSNNRHTYMNPVMHTDGFGNQEWRLGGKIHRTDGPAVIRSNGTQLWYINGEPHRTDGPAIVWPDGSQSWYLHGKFHRTDGPSKIFPNGIEEWYTNGNRHRLDGPAVIWANGDHYWFINDNDITKEVNDWMDKHDVTWPWDAETQAQFVLTFT
jgi:hypothetical protein